MSVSKEASGTYEVQCWYRDWQGARKKKHRRGFKTKAAARKWERDFLLKAEGSPSMTFASFVEVYEADMKPRLKLNTWLTKCHIIDTKIMPYFGDKQLDQITAADVMAWQNELRATVNKRTRKPLSQTYLRTINNQLSAIVNHAVKYYGLNDNPLRKVGKVGSENAGEMLFWTKGEYLKFSDAVMDKPLSFTAFEVLYWMGIREGELLALVPEDFDFERLLLRINKSYQRLQKRDVITPPKTPKSNRVLAMPDFLAEEVADYIRLFGIQDGERVFPVGKSYLYREMERGCRASGVRRNRVHDLRHSHVSLLIDLGFGVLAIADREGHEAIDITYRYAHLFPNAQANMASALSKEGRSANE